MIFLRLALKSAEEKKNTHAISPYKVYARYFRINILESNVHTRTLWAYTPRCSTILDLGHSINAEGNIISYALAIDHRQFFT